jgi:arginase
MAAPDQITIVEVPSDVGSVFAGKSRAPAAIKSTGLVSKLEEVGYTVNQLNALPDGNIEWRQSSLGPNGVRSEEAAVAACHSVKQTIATSLRTQKPESAFPFQLILGGECLICPAVMSAFSHHSPSKRFGLLYIDADCDLSVPGEAGGTGNIAGMTLTHLTLRTGALDSMKTFSKPDGSGVVDSSSTVLFGLNSASPANKRDHLGYLFSENFRVITSSAIAEAPETRAKQALSWLEERVDYILLHLDVDVIDPGEFPLGNVPNWTGVGFSETMTALRLFLKSSKIVGLIIAEVNPDHDPGLDMTRKLVHEVVEGLKERKELHQI